MDFNAKGYLPNSEERIRYLRKIINRRPVAILVAGPSISELENRIEELRHADIIYTGINNFFVQEKHILQKIDKHFSIIMICCDTSIASTMEHIVESLDRDEENMFISTFSYGGFTGLPKNFDINQFFSKYDKKLLFINSDFGPPREDCPLHFKPTSSLLGLIQLMIIGEASKIILFGADGYTVGQGEHYYRQSEYTTIQDDRGLFHDTQEFNILAQDFVRNIYNIYNIVPIEIFNCSENSFLTPFPKISYDSTFEMLNNETRIINR